MALCNGVTHWRRIALHCLMRYAPAIRSTEMCRQDKVDQNIGSAQKRTTLPCPGIGMQVLIELSSGKVDQFNVVQWHWHRFV